MSDENWKAGSYHTPRPADRRVWGRGSTIDAYSYARGHLDTDITAADFRDFANSQGHGYSPANIPTNIPINTRANAHKGGANRDVHHCLR